MPLSFPRLQSDRQIVNMSHPLNQGRVAWWLILPSTYGGGRLIDLMESYPATLSSFGSNAGWRGTTRPGGRGHILGDGVAANITSAGLTGTYTNLTIAAWLYRSSTSQGNYFGWGGTDPHRFQVQWYNDGNIYWVCENGSGTYLGTSNSQIGWHRLLMTLDGTQSSTNRVKAFVDGVSLGVLSVSWPATYTATGTFQILYDQSDNRFSPGAADDASVWGRTLSSAEALADYDLSRAGYPGVLISPTTRTVVSMTTSPPIVLRQGATVKKPGLINLSHPLLQNRLAWWLILPSTYGGGRLVDLMGSNHGALVNFAPSTGWKPTSRPGGFGQLTFNEAIADNYVQIQNTQTFDNWYNLTIAFSFQFNAGANVQYARILEKGANNEITIAMGYITANTIYVQNFGITSPMVVSTPITDGKWHRMVFVVVGIATVYYGWLYLDGILNAIGSCSFNNVKTYQLSIGHYNGSTGYAFTGGLDDISWNARSWDAKEVAEDYQLSKAGYPGVIDLTYNSARKTFGFVPPVTTTANGCRIVRRTNTVNMGHPLNQNRVAWWLVQPSNYGGGRWVDIIGGNHGAFVGGSSTCGWRPTTRKGSTGDILFNGSNNVIVPGITGASNSTQFMSMSCWIYCTQLDNYAPIMGTRPTVYSYIGLLLSAGAGNPVTATWANTPVEYGAETGLNINLNEWTYVGASVAPNTVSTNLITICRASATLPMTFATISVSAGSQSIASMWFFGLDPTASSAWYGRKDSASIWNNRALTRQDFYQDYDQGLRGYPDILYQKETNVTATYISAANNLVGDPGQKFLVPPNYAF